MSLGLRAAQPERERAADCEQGALPRAEEQPAGELGAAWISLVSKAEAGSVSTSLTGVVIPEFASATETPVCVREVCGGVRGCFRKWKYLPGHRAEFGQVIEGQ